MSGTYTIGVVGNPNCGKTTLFNTLTGAKQRVGNWPGVTVERKIGQFRFEETDFELVDLPGTYSLDVTDREVSLDEQIARDYVHAREADLIVNILDASNLERNLYLTTQLVEMRVPLLVVLNMVDVAEEKGRRVNAAGLANRLGCPVLPVVASRGNGIEALKRALLEAVEQKPVPTVEIRYDTILEDAITGLVPKLSLVAERNGDSPRWLAARLLEGDDLARELVGDAVSETELKAIAGDVAEEIDILLADARYGLAHALARDVIEQKGKVSTNRSDRIDRVMLNRVLGIPIFLLAMYLMFMFTINIGGAFIDFFDILAGTLFVDGFAEVLGRLGSPEWLTVGLAGGIGGGIQVVATFIPVIAALFLFLSFLEDSGYMARAAFVMDRFMRAIGLPGKSFVPLIVGFGCNVPAIMATRTLENQRDRILTVLMAPFMSCGARLPVYALFAAAFFPVGGQNVVFGLYLIGIAAAVVTGLIMKTTLLQGESTPFVMELPPYHLPTFKGVLIRTWDRTKSFMFRAGKVIVPMVLVLNVLNSVGTDGSIGNEDSDKSLLAEIGRTIAPAFSPLGLDEENWPAAVGIFTGVLAKEAVVGTLDASYSALAAAEAGEVEEETPYSLGGGISEALASIPANLGDALGTWADPLGLGIGDVSDQAAAAEAQEVTTGTFGTMAARFDGAAGAFAYLLFILLYFPCVAAIAAVYRETTPGWTLFVAAWTTGLGYMLATLFYQAAIFSRHPGISLAWIGGMGAIFTFVVLMMRYRVQRDPATTALAAHEAA
ncbi:Fe(2+) transporter permease subunit FeoB [Candidatus Thiosymbion oneisti]|uniref:Fe(2+) transporter permease subunit FeoB n=1 Tax=Candidatus Thiosymbion oneisti TaxID=589554 RepID=UPI000A79C16D|nr:Fe(2+) transporter permease subunit FeoB [Candidatus Thiosymbion oneisti]